MKPAIAETNDIIRLAVNTNECSTHTPIRGNCMHFLELLALVTIATISRCACRRACVARVRVLTFETLYNTIQ